MASEIHHQVQVPADCALRRLDQVAAELLPQYSRSRLQQWILDGSLTVDGMASKSKRKLVGGEVLGVCATLEEGVDRPEDIPLEIVYEDEAIVVLNKPAGLVVHPGAGNPDGTLVNALLHYDTSLGELSRAGIVHRLDKDTSGLMVVARTIEAEKYLVTAIQERAVTRIYDAVAYGVFRAQIGTVDEPLARHPVQRTKMSVRADGKPARTHYRVKKQYREHALVECRLETGRTHQIRVHMQSLRHPLVGDVAYDGHFRRPKSNSFQLEQCLRSFSRQALHARKLALMHPDGRILSWQVPPPDDFLQLVEALDAAAD